MTLASQPNTTLENPQAHTTSRALALAALGIVYGDLGTSPLYALKEVFGNAHHPVPISPENVLGILSVVFWALLLVVTVKYVFFIMRADNQGEGGIMALMALALKNTPEGMQRKIIVGLGLFGAALFYGDGVVTPAISVLSAVEGLEIVTTRFSPFIIPITIGVLILLFSIQRYGTAKVGHLFGPIMLIWFAILAILGIGNILAAPSVLRAMNPIWALSFLSANPSLGFFSLGAVVLCLTGTEALYADMGHFGRKPIQVAWYGLVLPSLIFNYFGQGALLLSTPSAIENPFYLLAPAWALLPLVLLSTVATVIASQSVISGVFSMTQQAIQLGYSPRLRVLHTSESEKGQIYLPAINWTLLFVVLALVLLFGSSSNLAAAYGIAVTGTMLITSALAFIVLRRERRWAMLPALLLVLPFTLIDLSFFAANATKFFNGGWFPLAFGILVFCILSTWKKGRALLFQQAKEHFMALTPFIANLVRGKTLRVPGMAIFLTANPTGVPHALLHSLKHYKVLHEKIAVVTITITDAPHVPPEKKLRITNMTQGFWEIDVYFGFKEAPDLPAALALSPAFSKEAEPMETSYFLARETLIPRKSATMPYWRSVLFATMFRNASNLSAHLKLPPNQVVELGTQIEL